MIGIVISARLGSARSPGKHLVKAGGHPMIHWLCRRMLTEFDDEVARGEVSVVIATSEKPGNEPLKDAVADLPVKVFFGPDANIPLRQLQSARAFGMEAIISVDGDDILCSTAAVRDVYLGLKEEGPFDLVRTEGLPLGMNCQGYPTAYLATCLEQAHGSRFETGWGRLFHAARVRTINRGDHDIMGDLRFTLDYPEDAAFFTAVIEGLGERVLTIPDSQLIAYVEEKGLQRINAHLKERYWSNYHSESAREKNG